MKRLVKDHLLANNLKPHTIQTTNPMVWAFKAPRQSYATYLDHEEKKTRTKEEEKAKYISLGIENLKQKLKSNQKAVSMMENEYTQCVELKCILSFREMVIETISLKKWHQSQSIKHQGRDMWIAYFVITYQDALFKLSYLVQAIAPMPYTEKQTENY